MIFLGSYIKKLGRRVDDKIESLVERNLPRGQNLVYLDLGCDDGTRTMQRAQRIGTDRVLGIEVEESRLQKAKKHKIKVYKADLNRKWPIQSNFIDCLTATETIEHLIDVDNFMAEIRRVLKKGGTAIIATDNLSGWHNIFALLLGNQPYSGPYISRKYPLGHHPNAEYYQNNMNNTMRPHLNVMTTKTLGQLAGHYGFKVKQLLGVGFFPFPMLIANQLARLDKYHAAHCLVIIEKNS